ncbi:MAG: gliding motility protein GldM [Bacteroidetes bacterium]|nr:gliding motility protein GldM [Bacteroidota bacterium]
MAGYKETPRQKMIAMMYLVLTALLALNVSKEILDAFLVVNKSMESTNESIAAKSRQMYTTFENQYTMNQEKVGPFWEEAQNVKEKSTELINYLEDLKLELVAVAERKTEEEVLELYYTDTVMHGERKKMLMLNKVPTKDKYDATTNFMVRPGDEGEAYVLSAKMDEYRKMILDAMNLPADDKTVGLITNMEGIVYRNADGQRQDWEFHNFYHTILAADVTIINKIIQEVRSSEFNAIVHLYRSISEQDFKFGDIAAKIIPKSTYIFKGQQYEADVLVAAFDQNLDATIKIVHGADSITAANINQAQVYEGQAGFGRLEFPANREGVQKYAGVIELVDPETNQMTPYPFRGEYIVAPPALTVSPLKMNVFYIGVKNPVSISAPGIPMDKVTTSISVGKLYKDPQSANYIVEVPKGENQAIVSATANIDGNRFSLGQMEFRVKRVPTPTAMIAGQTGGKIDKNALLAAGAIIPDMKDFEFDLYFEVTGFTFATIINGDWIPKNVSGNRFNSEINGIIRNGRSNQKFFFENIQAKGPDGTVRSLNPINLELQ